MSPKRLAVLAASFVAVSLVLGFSAIMTWTGTPRSAARSGAVRAPSHRELVGVLAQLDRSWRPAAKKRAISSARPRREALRTGMRWMLGQPGHPLLDEAIELCAEFNYLEFHPLLVNLARAGSPERRALALTAAERLVPWSSDEIVTFLADKEARVVAAALRVARDRDPRPTAAILALLVHPLSEVRSLALAALPATLGPADHERLGALMRDRAQGVNACLLAALARVGAEAEESLRELFEDSRSLATRQAALEALASSVAPLAARTAGALQSLVWSEGEARELRARALYCLERRGGSDPDALEAGLPTLPPVLAYFAARCLIRAGRPSGVEALLVLERPEGLLAARSERRGQVRLASRLLLCQLAGTQLSADPEEWSRWFAEGPELPSRLPEPRLAF